MKDRIIGLGKQFINFGLIGGINTILNLVIYWICIRIGIHYLLANIIGFVITVTISYVLNNLFTFRDANQMVEWAFRTLLKVYVSYFFTGLLFRSNVMMLE